MSISKVKKIEALLKSIETGDTASVSVVNEAKYVQHNPQTHEGSEGLAALFQRLSKTNPKVNMVRGFHDHVQGSDYVFAQMEYDFSSRKICFEVFRFEEGQAVEHWDNIQPRLGPNPSGHNMVDGPTKATDLEMTEENRQFVRTFIETVLVNKQINQLTDFIDENTYTEHNPLFDDNLSTLKSALAATGEKSIEYQRLHRVLAQGNFVLSVTEGKYGGDHTSFYDLFRLENGKIVEHWDTTEHIAPKSEWKNANGKF